MKNRLLIVLLLMISNLSFSQVDSLDYVSLKKNADEILELDESDFNYQRVEILDSIVTNNQISFFDYLSPTDVKPYLQQLIKG